MSTRCKCLDTNESSVLCSGSPHQQRPVVSLDGNVIFLKFIFLQSQVSLGPFPGTPHLVTPHWQLPECLVSGNFLDIAKMCLQLLNQVRGVGWQAFSIVLATVGGVRLAGFPGVERESSGEQCFSTTYSSLRKFAMCNEGNSPDCQSTWGYNCIFLQLVR